MERIRRRKKAVCCCWCCCCLFLNFICYFSFVWCRSIPQTIQLKLSKPFHRTKKLQQRTMNKVKIRLRWNHRTRSRQYWRHRVMRIFNKLNLISTKLNHIPSISSRSNWNKSCESCTRSTICTGTTSSSISRSTAAATSIASKSHAYTASGVTTSGVTTSSDFSSSKWN